MKKIKLPTKILKPSRLVTHSFAADTGGCGYYRIIFPSLSLLNERYNGFSFMPFYGMQFIGDSNYYRNKLFVIFQRSAEKVQLDFIVNLKKTLPDLKIIYEIDDLLIPDYIPKYNKAYQYFKEREKYVVKILRNVDVISTSTQKLKNVYLKYNENVVVTDNYLPNFLWNGAKEPKERNKKPRILWAGSDNHFSIDKNNPDKGDFGKNLINYIKSTIDDYQWVFMGGFPLPLMDVYDKIEKIPWKNMLEYPQYLKSLNIDLGIAPLENNFFNECKTSIKAKEYTVAGIPSIFSNLEPYKNMKCVCDTDEKMIEKIEYYINNDDERIKLWKSNYEKLKGNIFLEENNNNIKQFNNILKGFNCSLP